MRIRPVVLAVSLLLAACGTRTPVPDDATTLRQQLEQADLALRQARLIDAERHYRTLSQSHPRLPDVWLRLGNIYTRQGQREAAMQAYRDGLRHAPQDGRLWHNLALVELKQAVATLEAASEVLDDEDPWRAHIEQLHEHLLPERRQVRADSLP